MSAKVKKLRTKGTIKRRFKTLYYSTIGVNQGAYVSQGAASSEDGAKKATVVRVFLEQYPQAIIIDRVTGVVIYTLRHTSKGITVHYGTATGDAAQAHHNLRRVK
jgi:hypothetical protein